MTEDDLADYRNAIDYDYAQELDGKEAMDSYLWAFGRPAFVFSKDGNGYYVELRDKAEYFKFKYERFKSAIGRIANATFEQFCNDDHFVGLEYDMFELNEAYDDRRAFWLVGIEYYMCPVPLDEWVRHASNGDRLYLGAVFDYHFRARLGKPLRGAPPPISG